MHKNLARWLPKNCRENLWRCSWITSLHLKRHFFKCIYALQAILNDTRVKAAREAGRGGRLRDEKETAAAGSLTPAADGRQEASPSSSSNGSGSGQAQAAEGSDARRWIENWREQGISTE